MAEEFHTGVCSGSWWNAMRGGFEGPPMSAAAAAVSCSAAASDAGSLGWGLEMMESKTRSGEESAGASASGGSTLTFHGAPGVHASDPMAGATGFLMEQTVPMSGSGAVAFPSMDWSQALPRSNRRNEEGFQAMLQDHLSSSRSYLFQETSMDSDETGHKGITDNQWNRFKDFNQALMMSHQAHFNSGGSSGDGADADFRGVPYACPTTLLHDHLLDQDMKPRTSTFDMTSCSANFLSSPSAGYRSSSGEPPDRFPHDFLRSSPLRHQHQLSSDHHDHEPQFSIENPPFWNASTQTQFYTDEQAFEGKPSHSSTTITRKLNSEGARNSSSAKTKSASNEPALKKSRIETPSPLPTFKVRKEKLGDRITALQQLVSPFGKTDTASVLHEAIEYIKFLHDQVGVLSTPYLKNGPAMQHNYQKPDKSKDGADGQKQDLRSRGLCLVPVSATFPVVSEPTTADFWTPTFGATYR